MADRNFSPHQQKIIQRYYDSRDQSDEQRLAEIVTELYLATGNQKKCDKLWKTSQEMMGRLGVPESRIKNVMEKGRADLLAEVVKDLQQGKIKKPSPAKKEAGRTDQKST
jgi:alcohol dehydrogenase class IV